MSDYKNTLRTGDQVWDVIRKRRGVVDAQPREKSVLIAVILDGNTAPKSIYVGDLRYIEPGKKPEEHEDVPPIEGDLPPAPESYRQAKEPREPRAPRAPAVQDSPTKHLEDRRAAIKVEMDAMTKRATELRAEDEKLEKAIAVLK